MSVAQKYTDKQNQLNESCMSNLTAATIYIYDTGECKFKVNESNFRELTPKIFGDENISFDNFFLFKIALDMKNFCHQSIVDEDVKVKIVKETQEEYKNLYENFKTDVIDNYKGDKEKAKNVLEVVMTYNQNGLYDVEEEFNELMSVID